MIVRSGLVGATIKKGNHIDCPNRLLSAGESYKYRLIPSRQLSQWNNRLAKFTCLVLIPNSHLGLRGCLHCGLIARSRNRIAISPKLAIPLPFWVPAPYLRQNQKTRSLTLHPQHMEGGNLINFELNYSRQNRKRKIINRDNVQIKTK